MLAGRAVGGLLAVVGGGESPQRPTLEPMSSKGPAMLGWLGGKGKSEKREKKPCCLSHRKRRMDPQSGEVRWCPSRRFSPRA
jgi:hypothetical protein